MNLTYEQLMDRATMNIDRSGGDVEMDYSGILMQRAMTEALMAIAQELHEINDRIGDDRKTEKSTIDEDIRRGLSRFEEKIIGSSEQ